MADIRAKHLVGDEKASSMHATGKAESKTTDVASAAQVGSVLEDAMRDIEPSPEMLAMGIPREQMAGMIKLFAKHVLEKQAAKMPSQHVPVDA